eukprot:g4271.t1
MREEAPHFVKDCNGLCAKGQKVTCWKPEKTCAGTCESTHKWASCGNDDCLKIIDPEDELQLTQDAELVMRSIGAFMCVVGVLLVIIAVSVLVCPCCNQPTTGLSHSGRQQYAGSNIVPVNNNNWQQHGRQPVVVQANVVQGHTAQPYQPAIVPAVVSQPTHDLYDPNTGVVSGSQPPIVHSTVGHSMSGVGAPPVVAAVAAPQPQPCMLTCPPDKKEGDTMQAMSPAGVPMMVTIPPGCSPGQQFQVMM